MNAPVILLGAGGHAKVLLECLRLCNAEVIGLVDIDADKANTTVMGSPVLGGEDVVCEHPCDTIALVNAIGSSGSTERRDMVYQRFRDKGYMFANVIHPSATIAADVALSDGAHVMAGAIIQPGAQIGPNSIINTNSVVDHDSIIGRSVHVAPGATICGDVSIEDGCHVGPGAIIIHGIRIGENCLIGAGAVVTRNFSGTQTIVGVPAKAIIR